MSLAIECGATHSSVLYMDGGKELKRFTMGSANFKMMNERDLEEFFQSISTTLGKVPVNELGIGMPGIITEADGQVVKITVRKLWPEVASLWVGSDVDTAMACLETFVGLKVIVIGGTGSNCFGQDENFKSSLGGFGHLLGDRGSSYAIAVKALRLSLREYNHSTKLEDGHINLPQDNLLTAVIKELKLKSLNDLVTWSTQASKTDVAALTSTIIELSRAKNSIASRAIEECITELAQDCACLVKKFSLVKKQNVEIGLTGSLFTKNDDIVSIFKKVVANELKGVLPFKQINFNILHETVQGALKVMSNNNNNNNIIEPKAIFSDSLSQQSIPLSEEYLAEKILPVYRGLPQTECRNPKSMNLDNMPIGDAIDLMISEESAIYKEIMKQKPKLEILIKKTSIALQSGGRLFYVGAGTSGRLGILDASECPPTFRTQPELVQGIIAGGFSSVSKAKEGAEDSIIDGMNAIMERSVCSKDIVIGIAASGRTPFVWGAMHQAQQLEAFTTFLTFNVALDIKIVPDLVLAMDLGPEILTGSTRLKSGSATKCVLNMLSTLAMVQMGKCFENLMIDLNPANQKLKQRALRIVLLMTNNIKNVTEEVALPVLVKNRYDIKSTVLELRQSFVN